MLLISITSLCADGLWLNAVHYRATQDFLKYLIEHLHSFLNCYHFRYHLEFKYAIIVRNLFFCPEKAMH